MSYKLEKETRIFLKEHTDLMIIRSDKGNVTDTMSCSSYLEKYLALLNDAETYEKIISNPVSKLENSCNKMIKSLKDRRYIEEITAIGFF